MVAADKALESRSVVDLIKMIADEASSGVNKNFTHAFEKKYGDKNVEAGREFVED